jgi:hypothetical protein
MIIFFMRLWIPESPRGLIMHGHLAEAKTAIEAIEHWSRRAGAELAPVTKSAGIRLRWRDHTPRHFRKSSKRCFRGIGCATFVGPTLMAAQALFYNAIFFTYALVLTKFYSVSSDRVGWYILPFAAGNFLGPVVPGHLFDTVGRPDYDLDLRTVRAPACRLRCPVRIGYAFSADANTGLDDRLLLCVTCRECCLSDGQ